MTIKRMQKWMGTLGVGLSVGVIAPGCVIILEPKEDGGTQGRGDDEWGEVDTAEGEVDTSDEADSWEATSVGDDDPWGETVGDDDPRGETTTFGDDDPWGETVGMEETGLAETGLAETGGSESGYAETMGGTAETGGTETEGTTGSVCEGALVHPRRSLIETSEAALAGLNMAAILERAALSADKLPEAEFTFTRLLDSFTTSDQAALAGGSHCDDELVDGQPGLNGYPLLCPRAEAGQVGQMDSWFPVAYVNRFDLAATDGSDCGEQRIIMASNAQDRAFLIFEARIPNPEPQCGLAACQPVAEFWAELGEIDDAGARGALLRQAFIDGHPDLEAAGFEPFMSGVNMSFGSGQIRSNSFDENPWTLRQFEFVDDGGLLGAMQVPVSDNSFAPVWNDLDPHPAGLACRASILANLDGLLTEDLAAMGLDLADICDAAESADDKHVAYADELISGSGDFEQAIAAKLDELGSDITPVQLANRATFASNCMGCHESATNMDLGGGLVGPASTGFAHVSEIEQQSCDGEPCFMISPALEQELLPARASVLQDFLDGSCEQVCEQAAPNADALLLQGPATLGLPDARLGVDALMTRAAELEALLSRDTLIGRPRGSH